MGHNTGSATKSASGCSRKQNSAQNDLRSLRESSAASGSSSNKELNVQAKGSSIGNK